MSEPAFVGGPGRVGGAGREGALKGRAAEWVGVECPGIGGDLSRSSCE